MYICSMIAYSIFSIAYGYRPKGDNDELLIMIKKMMEDFAVFAAPGNFLVDNLPIRKSGLIVLLRILRASYSKVPAGMVPWNELQEVRRRRCRKD